MKFTESTRQLVQERARGLCEVCGSSVDVPQLHHRKPRGMGGTKNPASRSAANALLVHFRCHEWIERNRTEAYKMGYLVHQTDESVSRPVLLPTGWFCLMDDGSLLPACEPQDD